MKQPKEKLEALFEAALGFDSSEQRSEYLARACPDLELRREVESLLEAHLHPDGVFADERRDSVLTAPSERLHQKPGTVIGRYKLLQPIGEGGCGVVYMAEQEEPVRRRVALKIIKLGMDTKSVIARFEAERQALALMDHANIAKVFDAGSTDNGRPYFVMELVRGIKITDYCDEKQLSTRERLELFGQVCHAIQHAHQKGIVHRDLKPSNILVSVNDGVAMPKVIDFGIAKATTDQPLTDKTVFTAFEQFIGTPAYMSPEQAEITNVDVDTRSDIYSLGVLLYELLTGKTPFDAGELLKIGLDEMRRAIREREPERPSTRVSTLPGEELTTTAKRRGLEPPKLANVLRGDLDWIVMRCLEKDRARRYETANGLAMDIQRHLNSEPVVACPPSKIYRLEKLVRRNKLAFAAASAVVVALAIGLGVALWQSHEKTQAYRAALTAQKAAQSEAVKSRQVAKLLQDMLQGVGPEVAKGRDVTVLKEILGKTSNRIGNELTNQPEIEAELRSTVGDVYLALGEPRAAELTLRRAVAILKELHPKGSKELADAILSLARAREHRGDSAEAEVLCREAIAIGEKVLAPDDPDLATGLHDLAWVLYARGKMPEAEQTAQRALAIDMKSLGPEDFRTSTMRNLLALIKGKLGELDRGEAEKVYREVLRIAKQSHGNEDPQVAIVLCNLADILQDQGKLQEAEAAAQEALQIERKVLGPDHPSLAQTLRRLGSLKYEQGSYAEAERLWREAVTIWSQALEKGTGCADCLVHHLINLAVVLEAQGKLPEAEAMFRDAFNASRRWLAEEDPLVGRSFAVLNDYLLRQGKRDEVEKLQGEALELERKLLESDRPDAADSLTFLAIPFLAQGKLADAERMCREALAMARKKLGDTNSKVAEKTTELAAILIQQNKLDEAEKLYNDFLSPAKGAQTNSAVLFQARGEFFARTTRWKEAAADLGRALELRPDDHLIWHSLAAVLVQQGDPEAYREHCRKSVERFGNTTDGPTAHRIAKDCLILPSSGIDFETVARMVETSLAGGTNQSAWPFWACTKALAEYRLGHFAEALDWGRTVLSRSASKFCFTPETDAWVDAQTYAALAMAQWRLQQDQSARASLAMGLEVFSKLPKLESGDLGPAWLDWIFDRALLHEAKELIEGQTSNGVVQSPKSKVQGLEELSKSSETATNNYQSRAQ